MTGLRRAHDVVGGRVQRIAHSGELRGCAVGKLPGAQALASGGLLHFLAMFVHAGDEQHFVAVEPFEPGDGVRRDALIGVPDMGGAITVGNSGRNIESLTSGHGAAV